MLFYLGLQVSTTILFRQFMFRKFLSWCGDCIGDNEDHKNKTESESDNESNSEYEYSDSDCHIDEEHN